MVRYEPPELVIRPHKPLPADFVKELAGALKAMTATAWDVAIADGPASPSLLDQEKAAKNALRDAVLATPVVKAAFEAFPEAELLDYSAPEQAGGKRSAAS